MSRQIAGSKHARQSCQIRRGKCRQEPMSNHPRRRSPSHSEGGARRTTPASDSVLGGQARSDVLGEVPTRRTRPTADKFPRPARAYSMDTMPSTLASTRSPRASRVPEVMLWGPSGPLESLLACGVARRSGTNVIDLFLRDDDAAQGGMVTISMQVDVRCPDCDGHVPAIRCSRCAGTRKVSERFSAWLAVPPDVPDQTVLLPSVDLPGMIARPQFRVRRL